VGETFRLEEDLTAPRPEHDVPAPPRIVTVVGVSRDVPGFRFSTVRDADVFVPTSVGAPESSLVARVNGDPDQARQGLLERLTRIDPNLGMIVTLRSVARLETLLLGFAFWVSVVLGGFALLLTVSGLFSVLSYLVEQRTKEIGVRMALGASPRQVTRLILSQATRPVMYGLVAGAGLAATLATALLATPNGVLIAQIVHLTDPAAYAASLIVIIAASLAAAWVPATRAARVDPMQTLRRE
jgi:predicted lysophospholipase L1 biosynthesis ABC-type transport system permease subunit